ncbi:MAG: hypothetical protein E6J28_14970 [Chloroflexi bacterium]|nr:MAG: hypothetical protein E6J28_14970 [Chloroflexota bacterium]
MVLGQAAAQEARIDHAPEQCLLVVVLEALQAPGRDAVDRLLLGRGREVDLVVRAPLQRLAAAAPGEDEVDRGEHLERAKLLDHV